MSTEVKEFELKAKVEQKAVVSYDKEGIEAYVSMVENKYNGLVFTEENLPEAKEERAKLNKLKDGVDTYRKDITAELTSEIKVFDEDFKGYAARIAKVSKNIDEQVKVFEKKEEEKRLETARNFMKSLVKMREQYTEFLPQLLELVDQSKIFTLKGSYTEKGEVSKKLADFIDLELAKYDEIITARKAAEELLQQKRELIVSQCKSISQMLKLELELSPKQFAYLKDYDLSAITGEIQRAGQEQKEKEERAIKRIEEEARIKAEKEAERKIMEESKVEEVKESISSQPEPQREVLEPELVQEPTQEIKSSQKLFYGVLEFEGISLAEATAFRKFLDENNIKFKVIKSEVK